MKTKKGLTAVGVIIGAMLIGVFAVATANERITDDLAINAQSSTDMVPTYAMNFEGKCGEGKCGEGEAEEGKSGEKSKEAEGKKKEAKKSKKKKEEKKEEAKCGEGKCGGQ